MAKTKAFKITQNNQYIQEINLNAGEYTFSANIRADSASITVCKFSLLVGDVWLEYDLTDQIYIGQFQKVKKVIQLNDKATKLSLISSGSGEGRIFHVDRPMFEEGSNAGTPKPNELDIEEQAEASNVKVTIGIPYYEFRKDAEGGTVQETLTIPFQIFKGDVRVNVLSANIGTLYKPSNVMVLDVVGVYNSVNVIILKEFTASDGKVVFSIPVEGRNYEAEFQFKVKEVKDGDDGENAKWIKLNATATQIKVDEDNVLLPESISVFAQMYNLSGIATWLYSINGGSFTEVAPTGVSRNQNVVTITSANVNFEVLTIQASKDGVEDAITISRVVDGKDGKRGVPGKSPVTKEYRVGQTYYNNDVAIHYVYYRAGNSWWKLKDSVESHTASASVPSTTYFEQLSSVEVMVAETIIAENANLAEFIFKDKKLFSQLGTNSAGDSIKLGEYVQFQFGIYNSTTPPASSWSGWNDTPPTTTGNYLWIRHKITSGSVWTVKRVTGTDPDFTVQFGALKDGPFFNPPYQAGRNWMKMSDGRVYAITEELALGDYDPNLWLDGKTGVIMAKNGYFEGSIRVRHVGGGETRIDPDGIRILNDSGIQNIRFGIKNGFAVMEYYDNDGQLLYDLGPSGIGKVEIREERWTPVKLIYVASTFENALSFPANINYKESRFKTEITCYRYTSKIVAGVNEDVINDGRLYNSNNKSSEYIPLGVYTTKSGTMEMEMQTNETGVRIYPHKIHPNNEAVYDRNPLYMKEITQYTAGKLTQYYFAYWHPGEPEV